MSRLFVCKKPVVLTLIQVLYYSAKKTTSTMLWLWVFYFLHLKTTFRSRGAYSKHV